MEDDRDTFGDVNNARYTSSSTASASITTSDCPSVPEISFKSVPCVSLVEPWEEASTELPPGYYEDVSGSQTVGALRYATNSESEVFDSVVVDDIDKKVDRSMCLSNCHTPSVSALLSVSLPTRRSSNDLRQRLRRRGSLHQFYTSSQASDRTMIDHGPSLDPMTVLTPDRKSTARRDLVKAYLSRSSGGRLQPNLWYEKYGRKTHPGGQHNRSSSNTEISKGVMVSRSGGFFSFNNDDGGTGNIAGGVGGSGNSSAVYRSSSCPVKFNHLTSNGSNDNLARSVSYFSLELRDSQHTSVAWSRNMVQPCHHDDLIQYQLAVQSIKRGKYALSIRELLARGDVDDEEEECLESVES
ncbi:hypothetical protein LSM04_004760 [Trypanosoma melophagium]|uniref:uncharacterized protein n=1 Tax=Trypanosoma melophagium TaxID=715481 RepID=UPI00351A7679|nr:hypothetical protein LSM04_004760 [Trypanosoma melophagium]